MNIYAKSVALAAMMTVFPALTLHFTEAQSASPIVDCNNRKTATADCPSPIYKTAPVPPVVRNNTTPPAAIVAPAQPVVGIMAPQQYRHTSWQFDPRRHHRQNNRVAVFQFGFGGFFYDHPYWQQSQPDWQQPQPNMNLYRISCAQGIGIVAHHGYTRVRIVECNGTT
ncbi:MAG: hypothetical protein ABJA10_10770, partial [Aestuariivirga sp.]